MVDIESVLADVSYLIALDKKSAKERINKRTVLPDLFDCGIFLDCYYNKPKKKNVEQFLLSDYLGYLCFRDYLRETIEGEYLGSTTTNTTNTTNITTINEKNASENSVFNMNNMNFSGEKKMEVYSDEESVGEEKHHIIKILNLYYNILRLNLTHSNLLKKQTVYQIVQLCKDVEWLTETAEPINHYTFSDFIGEDNTKLNAIKFTCFELLQDKYEHDFLTSRQFLRYLQWFGHQLRYTVRFEDFNIHRIIGRGGFGEVYGCHKMDTGKLFAMKMLDKRQLKLRKSIKSCFTELKISQQLQFPFICQTYYCLQNSSKLLILMDLLDGGDLSYHLSMHGVFSESEAQFYAAEVLLGVEYLHDLQIVYRDLKPCNVLLDSTGHVRLADFGLAVCLKQRSMPSSMAGTMGYMAPEVHRKEPYGLVVDFYSFGCMLYRLTTGNLPYYNKHEKSKDRRVNWDFDLEADMDKHSHSSYFKDLLRGLLQLTPSKRLGYEQGSAEVKRAKFFENVIWESVLCKKQRPPIVPKQGEIHAANATEIGNFDDKESRKVRLDDQDEREFANFNYISTDQLQHELAETIFKRMNRIYYIHGGKDVQTYKTYQERIKNTDCRLYGHLYKQWKNMFLSKWTRKFCELYPSRFMYGANCAAMNFSVDLDKIDEVKIMEKHNAKYLKIESRQCKTLIFKSDSDSDLLLWHDRLQLELSSLGVITRKCPNLYMRPEHDSLLGRKNSGMSMMRKSNSLSNTTRAVSNVAHKEKQTLVSHNSATSRPLSCLTNITDTDIVNIDLMKDDEKNEEKQPIPTANVKDDSLTPNMTPNMTPNSQSIVRIPATNSYTNLSKDNSTLVEASSKLDIDKVTEPDLSNSYEHE